MRTVDFPGKARNNKRGGPHLQTNFWHEKDMMRCDEVQRDYEEKSGLGLWLRSTAAVPGHVAAEVMHLALSRHRWACHSFTGICKEDVPKALMPGMWDAARVS